MSNTEGLTKENFFNEMMQKYPLAMKDFCNWVDEYKQKNDWGNLFNFGTPHYAKQGWHNTKFHDLPLAMQMGIWNEYLDKYSLETCKEKIEMMLGAFEEGLQESNQQQK